MHNRCSSYIGRVGTVQEVSISSLCNSRGHALHELGHAIGLWHEHTRPDRQDYIKIIWSNIKETAKTNFWSYNHPNAADVEYDFGSIMHYPETAFAINKRKPTIEIIYKPLPSCLKNVGQRHELSFKDKLRVNKLYGCQGKINNISVTLFICYNLFIQLNWMNLEMILALFHLVLLQLQLQLLLLQ